MSESRPHPFALVFGGFANERFPAIRDALGGRMDRDSFLLAAPVLDLLRELRPDDGFGETVDGLVALVHAAFWYWASGSSTASLDEKATRALCQLGLRDDVAGPPAQSSTAYIQIAPRLVWGRLADEEAFEPLDGWFVSTHDAILSVVACFGVHPSRPGLSVVAVAGAAAVPPSRPDGSPLFSPTMPGGEAADLFAVANPAELLCLGWRAAMREEGG